jgi:hypothetical protein
MRVSGYLVISIVVTGLLMAGCSAGRDSATSPTPGTRSNPNREVGPARPPQPPPRASGTCHASKAQWAIGQRASTDLLERARNAAQASTARFIRPNEPITMEFFAWRLNLGLNKQDVVVSVSCG